MAIRNSGWRAHTRASRAKTILPDSNRRNHFVISGFDLGNQMTSTVNLHGLDAVDKFCLAHVNLHFGWIRT